MLIDADRDGPRAALSTEHCHQNDDDMKFDTVFDPFIPSSALLLLRAILCMGCGFAA